jgi:hypothetical protein
MLADAATRAPACRWRTLATPDEAPALLGGVPSVSALVSSTRAARAVAPDGVIRVYRCDTGATNYGCGVNGIDSSMTLNE